MKRHSRALDIVIQGDELEQHRIQLENNLQNTDMIHRLSLGSDDEYVDHESIEYPRHNSGPGAFTSFEIPSRDHFDGDTHSQIHPWSYRTTDDDEVGINPYEGGTVSTAAHHASALTLSAGLGGNRGGRRNVSLSGAEYDPDRPLRDMFNGAGNEISIFDIEPSRSKYSGMGSLGANPLVVDSTAELDRVLQSGYATVPTQQIQSPLRSSSSSSSDTETTPGSRPKLSDALRRVSFSPKRPRSSPIVPTRQLADASDNMPTPKPPKRSSTSHQLVSPARATLPQQPQVRLQPPTPSNSSSHFSKMVRGLTREIEHAKRGESSKPSKERANSIPTRQQTPARPSAMKQKTPTPKGKVYLPDITGLTSAVESPARIGNDYYAYRADENHREKEARLIAILNTVQSKLQQLEEENGISRRRVRELEMELEICKRDVTRERTRVLEREELIVQQQREVNHLAASASGRRNKGKGRVSGEQDDAYQKYKEVVEEKKALESLIASLRSHLARLTAELSSHRQLLAELRDLRDSDAQDLKQKSGEIEHLKEEVERLGGEVEVLRGVVEEGLRERRNEREMTSLRQDDADMGMSQDKTDDESSNDEHEERELEEVGGDLGGAEQDSNHHLQRDDNGEDEEPEPFDPLSIPGSSVNDNVNGPVGADRTMRTDNATLGSSTAAQSQPTATGPLFDSAVLDHVSGEMEVIEQHLHKRRHRPTVDDDSGNDDDHSVEDDEEDSRRRGSPVPRASRQHRGAQSRMTALPARPTAPTPNQSQRQHQHRQTQTQAQAHAQTQSRRSSGPIDETPFPQIRGEHLERLFFSAPEHNAKTCTMCNRRRRGVGDGVLEPMWIPSRNNAQADENDDDDDEGFAEGSEQDHGRRDRKSKRVEVAFANDPGAWRVVARREGIPPQTVVARVVRELEDDFAHYKSVYVELADQYKDMDPASDVPRRNILAKHLREVVDVLEQKGDQIASLYDLLRFKDKPISASVVVPGRSGKTRTVSSTAVASSSIGRSAGVGVRQDHVNFA